MTSKDSYEGASSLKSIKTCIMKNSELKTNLTLLKDTILD